jgi:hypothetical protein
MLWLADLAGSIFWIQFANSRNLEVASGLLLISLAVQLINKPSTKLVISLSLFSGILFFADPLQLYMTASLVILYGLYLAISKKLWRQFYLLAAVIIVGYIISSLILYLIQSVTKVEFFSVNSVNRSLAVFHNPIYMLYHTAKANIQLVSGANDISRALQVMNIAFAGVTVAAFVWLIWRKRLSNLVVTFIICAVIVIEGVYVASGQPGFSGDTSRYLIMLAPIIVLVIASMINLDKKFANSYKVIILLVILINGLLIFGSMATHWTTRLPADAHLSRTVNYLDQHQYEYAYASMDTAIPGLIFSNQA